MTKPGAKEGPKRLTDYVTVGAAALDGDKVAMDVILGEDIVVVDFVFIPSTKFAEEGKQSEFVVIQFKREDTGDELFTTSTGGVVVVDALKRMPKNYLPTTLRFIKPKGKRYYSIE